MIVTIDQTARTLSVDVGYVAAMAQEPVTFEGAPPPDGHYVGLLDESGTVLALSVISGGSAEMNLMTRQAYDFIASAPVGVPQEATLCVGSADSLIATGRINVVRNWLQDIVPPDDMAPSYPTTEALLNILKQVNDAANASGDYYARIKEAKTGAEEAAAKAANAAEVASSRAEASEQSASSAQVSASEAKQSATSAANEAQSASEAAKTASEEASDARASSQASYESAEEARRSAESAKDSQGYAEEAASRAKAAATAATGAADIVEEAKTNAVNAAAEAKAAATAAGQSATSAAGDAQGARTAALAATRSAEAAGMAAQDAATAAGNAQTSAKSAAGSATTAKQAATVAANAAAAAEEAKTAAAGSALSASASATAAASSATSAGQSASAAETAKAASEAAAKRAEDATANLGPATTKTLGLVMVGPRLNVDADGTIYPDAGEEPFGPLEGYKVTERVLGLAEHVHFAAFVQNGKLIAIYGQDQYDVYVCHGEACKKVIGIGARYNMKAAWQESDDSVKIVYTTALGDYKLATIVGGEVTDTVTVPPVQGNMLGSSSAVIPFGGYLVTTEGLIFDPSDLSEVGSFTAPVFNRLIFSEDGESLVFAAEGDRSRITRMTLSADGVPSFTYVSRLGDDKTLRAFAMPDGSCLLCEAFSDAGGGAILATSAMRLSEPYLYDATGGCLVAFKASVQLPYGMILCADGLKTVRAVKGPSNPSYSFVEVVDVYRRNFGYFGDPYSQAVGDYAFATPMNSKGDFAVFASLYYANAGGDKRNRYWLFTKGA